MFKFLQILTALFLLLIIFPRNLLLAQNSLNVTIRVGLVNLTLSGKTSPQAQVTIKKEGAVVGTTTSENNGDFSKTLTGLEEGIHQISLYATDTEGETTSTVNYSIALIAGTDTTLGNIILPSTVFLSDEEIINGDDLEIYGYGAPLSVITIFISNTGGSLTKTTVVDNNGYWQYIFETSELGEGEGTLYVKLSTTEGYQSEASKTLSFEIQSAPTPTPTPTVTSASTSETTQTGTSSILTPTPVPSPIPFFLAKIPRFLNFFDIDGSGKIEVTEVFASVKAWVDEWRTVLVEALGPEKTRVEEPLRCDLNRDGECNLIDLSILLYYVGK